MIVTKSELRELRRLLVDQINVTASWVAIPDKDDPGQRHAAEYLPGLESLLRRIDGELQNVNFVKRIQVEDV